MFKVRTTIQKLILLYNVLKYEMYFDEQSFFNDLNDRIKYNTKLNYEVF